MKRSTNNNERTINRENGSATGEVVGGLMILGGIVAGLYLGFADSKMDIMGDLPRAKTPTEINQEAHQIFIDRYQSASDAGKLAMLYSGASRVDVVNQKKKGNGMLAAANDDYEFTSVVKAQDCLQSTGYDTTPSEIRVSGWLVRGGGDISAIATVNVDQQNGDVLINPASGVGDVLRFHKQEDGLMLPSDKRTIDTLVANGCDPAFNPLAVQQ